MCARCGAISVTMYNFGSPRVGNKRFAEVYNQVTKNAYTYNLSYHAFFFSSVMIKVYVISFLSYQFLCVCVCYIYHLCLEYLQITSIIKTVFMSIW